MARRQRSVVVRAEEKLSGATVAVCCKVPSGLVLQLQEKQPRIVDSPQGAKEVMFWVKGGKTYTVRGPSVINGQEPEGYKRPMLHGGYAVTTGIPREFWGKWLEQNARAPYVESEMIFAMPDLDDAIAAAEEREELLSGLQPLSTEVDSRGRLKDPRVPRPISAGLSGIQPDDRVQE